MQILPCNCGCRVTAEQMLAAHMWEDIDTRLRLVEVWRERRDLGVQVRQQHGGGERLQPALCVPHRRRGVVVDGPKVAVARYLQCRVDIASQAITCASQALQQHKWRHEQTSNRLTRGACMEKSCARRTSALYTAVSPCGWYFPSTSPTTRAHLQTGPRMCAWHTSDL